jgi:putative transcriptional regulator
LKKLAAIYLGATMSELETWCEEGELKEVREFDVLCLTMVEELSPREIQKLRKKAGVSQEVFSRYLNVPVTLVSQWERGEKSPSGPSLKLLSLVKHKGLMRLPA